MIKTIVCPGVSLLMMLASLTVVYAERIALPPQQPSSGAGSNSYPHASFSKSVHDSNDLKYWLYEPQAPAPANAPVLLYLHGWSATTPDAYEKMLIHFARKGLIVVYPKFGGWFNTGKYESNAKTAYKNAIKRLQEPGHVSPDLTKTVFAGHSLGAHLALRMANSSVSESYPAPLALVLHEAAGADTQINETLSLENLSSIVSSTYLLLISREQWVSDPNTYGTVMQAWNNTPQIPRQQKSFIAVQSDSYGDPDLVSDHLGVVAGDCGWFCTAPLDAIDWWGYWRPTEAIINYVFYGKDFEFVFGNGQTVRYMGKWADGTPVAPKLTAADFNEI